MAEVYKIVKKNGEILRKVWDEQTTVVSATHGGGDTHQTFLRMEKYVGGAWVPYRHLNDKVCK